LIDKVLQTGTVDRRPAELASMISRRVHMHLGIGVFADVLGLVVLIKAIATPKPCSPRPSAGNSLPAETGRDGPRL